MRYWQFVVVGLLIIAGIVWYQTSVNKKDVDSLVAETQRMAAKQTPAPPAPAGKAANENILVLELKDGPVEIELLPDKAPKHVARIKELARQKFYDGLKFHRVIDGFMAQTGDPLGNGTGGSGKKLDAEFNDTPHVRGIVSMARAQSPNSADSQFFIVLKDSQFLDRNYTAWGRVISGMDAVDKIKKGNPDRNGEVTDPDKIISLRVKADLVAAR